MSYSKSVITKTRASFTTKRQLAIAYSDEAKQKLYSKIEGLKQIDAELANTLGNITIEVARGEKGIDKRIDELKKKNLDLQKRRAELLKKHGYPADYTDIRYECKKCNDTGYIGVEMCDCLKKALSHNTILESGLGHLIETQSFDTFSLDYYAYNPKILAEMTTVFETLRNYAENFSENSNNLLLVGKTGLGKTHLSTSIAGTVIEKGYNVFYETMQNIMSDFEYERFGRNYNDESSSRKTDIYFDCDLLIIDDVGTEMINNFSISCLYNLLNTRINNKKPIIINSNLSSKELREKYDARITSRLLGEFEAYMFVGYDVRLKKLI